MALRIAPSLSDPDRIYDQLIAMHDNLDEQASHRLNAGLILLLANHIGDTAIVEEAIEIARNTIV